MMMYRCDVIPRDTLSAVMSIKTKRTVQFVIWLIFVQLVSRLESITSPLLLCLEAISGNCSDLSACSKIQQLLLKPSNEFITNQIKIYYILFFVHWYRNEGIESSAFDEALDEISLMELDYKELAEDTKSEEEDF